MTFDTAMWIVLALWGVFNIIALAIAERAGRRRARAERLRFERDIDRRTR